MRGTLHMIVTSTGFEGGKLRDPGLSVCAQINRGSKIGGNMGRLNFDECGRSTVLISGEHKKPGRLVFSLCRRWPGNM